MHMTGDRPDVAPRQTAGSIFISVTLKLIQDNFTDTFRTDSRFTQKLMNLEYGHIEISYQLHKEDFYEENPLVCKKKLCLIHARISSMG